MKLTKGNTGTNQTPNIPERVVNGTVDGTMLGVDKLSDQQRRTFLSNSQTKAENNPTDNKQRDFVSNGNHRDAKEHNHAPDDNADATTEVVGHIRYDRNGKHRTNGHGRRKKSKSRAFGIVVCLESVSMSLVQAIK
jgi:hypothetical protein